MIPADQFSTAVPYVGELEGKPGCFICAGHNGHGEFPSRGWTICKPRVIIHAPRRDGQDYDVRPGGCNAFEGGNVGEHGAARLLPADVGKAYQEWIRGSGGLDGALEF